MCSMSMAVNKGRMSREKLTALVMWSTPGTWLWLVTMPHRSLIAAAVATPCASEGTHGPYPPPRPPWPTSMTPTTVSASSPPPSVISPERSSTAGHGTRYRSGGVDRACEGHDGLSETVAHLGLRSRMHPLGSGYVGSCCAPAWCQGPRRASGDLLCVAHVGARSVRWCWQPRSLSPA